jgi:hypothetical protein
LNDQVWEEETLRASARAVIWLACALALVGVVCAAAVHNGCFHPPPPVTRPDPATARGRFCAIVVPSHPWFSLTLGPTLVIVLIWLIARRRASVIAVGSLVLFLLLLTSAILANVLTFSATV